MQFRTFRSGFFVTLIVLVTVAFVWVVKGFFGPVFWAAVFALLFRRPYRVLRARLGGRESAAAALTLGAIVLLVLVPLGLLGAAFVREAVTLAGRVSSGEIDVQGTVAQAEALVPQAAALLDEYNVDLARVQEGLSSAAVAAGQFLATRALTIGQNAVTFVLMAFVMLYVLFFFIRDGERLVEKVIRAVPLGEERERRLLAKFVEVSRATVKGTLVIGAVQGLLGGVTFALLGLQPAFFWGVAMAVLSLLPAVGPAIVWLPAAVYLLATGAVVQGVVLILVGVFVIGLVDNLLRPVLVGRDTAMPDYLVLISTLGGLALFGLTGVVVGPVVAALFLVVWEMVIEEFGTFDDVRAVTTAIGHADDVPPLSPSPEAAEAAEAEHAKLDAAEATERLPPEARADVREAIEDAADDEHDEPPTR